MTSLSEAQFDIRRNSFIEGKDTNCYPSPVTGEAGRKGVWIHLQGSSMHVRSGVSPRLGLTKRDKETKNKYRRVTKQRRKAQTSEEQIWTDIEREV
jgi:hypothetical protein